MFTVPADSGGLVAVTCVELRTVKLVAAVVPNLTAVAPLRFVPVIVTALPPAVVPEVGETEPTVGAGGGGATNVNWSAGGLRAEVPLGVVTVTSTVPADSAGLTAVT